MFLSIALLQPVSASAHAILIESVPGHGATLDEGPPTIMLRFNAILERSMTFVELVDLRQVRKPLPVTVNSTGNQLIAQAPPLRPGVYTVLYKVLARDGHVTEGSIRFTILEH